MFLAWIFTQRPLHTLIFTELIKNGGQRGTCRRPFFWIQKAAEGCSKTEIGKNEPYYRLDDRSKNEVSLLKRGISVDQIPEPQIIDLQHAIKIEKKTDVVKLLKDCFDENWEDDEHLKFYVDLFQQDVTGTIEEKESECDCLDEEPGLVF